MGGERKESGTQIHMVAPIRLDALRTEDALTAPESETVKEIDERASRRFDHRRKKRAVSKQCSDRLDPVASASDSMEGRAGIAESIQRKSHREQVPLRKRPTQRIKNYVHSCGRSGRLLDEQLYFDRSRADGRGLGAW